MRILLKLRREKIIPRMSVPCASGTAGSAIFMASAVPMNKAESLPADGFTRQWPESSFGLYPGIWLCFPARMFLLMLPEVEIIRQRAADIN